MLASTCTCPARTVPVVLLALWTAICPPAALADEHPQALRLFLQDHCNYCHEGDAPAGGLDLPALRWQPQDADNFRVWVKIHDKVKQQEMPPPEEDRPTADSQTQFLRDLYDQLHQVDLKAQASRGRVVPPAGEDILRFGLLLEVARLAMETDLTRLVTLYYVGSSKTPSQPGKSFAYHNLSHHGQDAEKIEQLAILERDLLRQWGDYLQRMKASQASGGSLLDQTFSVLGAAMGNASSHNATNLPLLVAGGRLHHGQHLAFDPATPPPLCNLWVTALQHLGLETDRFGSSTSTLSGI